MVRLSPETGISAYDETVRHSVSARTRVSSSCGLNGFVTYASAPAAAPAATSASWACAVSKMTGNVAFRSRKARVTSTPERPGMLTSRIARSG